MSPFPSRWVVAALVSSVALLSACSVAPMTAPARLDLDAQPNGIAIRPDDGALFVTDDRSNAVLWSADRAHYASYAVLPVVAGEANSLSQLAFDARGALLVERFGFGASGAVLVVSTTGEVHTLTGPAGERRRLGLATLGPGRVLSSWFIKQGSQPPTGGVSLVTYDPLTYAATERDLVVGLAKPVGVATRGDTLFVSDQGKGAIFRYDLGALLSSAQPAQGGNAFAQIESPDLLAIDRSGTLYTKCHAHGLCRIASDGTVTALADDFQDARGVAVDDARSVLFVVDRAKASSGAKSAIRVFALPPAGAR